MKSKDQFKDVSLRAIAVCLVGLMMADAARAQVEDVPVLTESAKLVPNNLAEFAFFSVATNGDWALVGNSWGGFVDGVRSGNVSYFNRSSENEWLSMGEIGPGDPTEYMEFGSAIAIDNSLAVIGAPGDGSHAFGRGSAYLFENMGNGVWVERAKLLSDGAQEGPFGDAVSISGDTVVVSGSPFVYVFSRDGNNWPLTQILGPGELRPSSFGISVAISDDVLVVGSEYAPESGFDYFAYAYRRAPSGMWLLDDRLTSTRALPDSAAGYDVDTDGNQIIVGAHLDGTQAFEAGAAYIFAWDAVNGWVEQVKLLAPPFIGMDPPAAAEFGYAVAIEDDFAVIGEDQGGRLGFLPSGDAFVYHRSDIGEWKPVALLAPSDPKADEWFFCDDVDFESGTVIIGAAELGGGYVYEARSFEPIFNPISGSYFQLSYAPRGINWYEARDAAERMAFNGMTGHLATYASAEEENFVIAAFPEIEPNYVWLGASDEASEEAWQWITGEPWDYVNWDGGEPNGGTYENCLDYSDGVTRWNDESCSRLIYHYLIEFPLVSQEVALDIKPGNRRNVINPRSKGRFWVAILSDEEFDPLQVDPETVAFGPGAASPDRYKTKNVNADRVPDLMLRFRTPEVGLQCGDTGLELTGETYAGDSIIGTDAVKTVGCKKPKKGKKK